MRAVVYDAAEQFSVREVPTPEPGPGELRIRVLQAGFCGTDLHLHHGGFDARFPLTPGHEVVGLVDALGPDVDDFAIGEQISVNPNVHCGTCHYCRAGRLVLCEDNEGYGTQRPGFFAEYAVVPAALTFSVEGLPVETAVLTEPAACATHGLETVRPMPGSSALVFGAGPTGLLLAQLLASGGVSSVTVADPSAAKLATARGLGIDVTVPIELITPETAGALVESLRAGSPAGDGFDLVVEATGSPVVGELCVPLTRRGGTVLIYGVAPEDARISFPPYEVFRRELTIKGSFAEVSSFGAAIAALRTGRVRTDGLITHRFALEDFADAVHTAQTDRSAHKIVIVPGPRQDG